MSEFAYQIKLLGNVVKTMKEEITSEKVIRDAFILAFLQTLCYDVFNPLEVVPNYEIDLKTKIDTKIDFTILKNNAPVILIEYKQHFKKINIQENKLYNYFNFSKAKFGILTNGITYFFYNDLLETNKMDKKLFLKFNLDEINDYQIEELKKLHKSSFNA